MEGKEKKEWLNDIHEYQLKYKKQISKDRDVAEDYYKKWQIMDGIQPWAKTLIWSIIISMIAIVYFLKKKQKYCFKKKEADLDADNHYTKYND